MAKSKSTCNHCKKKTGNTICDDCRCERCRRLHMFCECKRETQNAGDLEKNRVHCPSVVASER